MDLLSQGLLSLSDVIEIISSPFLNMNTAMSELGHEGEHSRTFRWNFVPPGRHQIAEVVSTQPHIFKSEHVAGGLRLRRKHNREVVGSNPRKRPDLRERENLVPFSGNREAIKLR